jgi:hypothetical protein
MPKRAFSISSHEFTSRAWAQPLKSSGTNNSLPNNQNIQISSNHNFNKETNQPSMDKNIPTNTNSNINKEEDETSLIVKYMNLDFVAIIQSEHNAIIVRHVGSDNDHEFTFKISGNGI